MRMSLIIPFLNSHEVVRRQLLYLRAQDFPDEVEILFMDDGSDPPLEVTVEPPRNFRLIPTNDFRPWTSSLARNTAAKLARGDYFFMTDGDYIVSRRAMERALQFDGDRLGCRREFGVLDESGQLSQDADVLKAYGLCQQRWAMKGVRLSPHPNNFVMRREVFFDMGGYREDVILSRPYPQKEDTYFKRKLMEFANSGRIKLSDAPRPVLYMFPNGQYCGDVDYNPFDLFHTLTRKTPQNHWYVNPRYSREETA